MGSLRIILLTLLLAAVSPGELREARAADPFGPPPAPDLVGVHAEADTHRTADPSAESSIRTVPLARLTATRARPLFALSRRPPPPPKTPAPVATVSAPATPTKPRVTLIGTVVGPSDAYGIFRAEVSGIVVHLRTGETYDGWRLRSVRLRDAMLENDNNTAVLKLPSRELAGAPAGRRPDGAPTPVKAPPSAGSTPTPERMVEPPRQSPGRSDHKSKNNIQ